MKTSSTAQVPAASSPAHSVIVIGRLQYLVASKSRVDVAHIVDLEPNEFGPGPSCSCEDFRFRRNACRHLWAVASLGSGVAA